MYKFGEIVNNRYIIRNVLSSGESAWVYVVSDSQTNQEKVLKEFLISIQNPHQLTISTKQFEKEITLLAGLGHPGIPKFTEYFVIDDRQYVVMECIHGRSLREYLDKADKPMEEHTVLDIAGQIADTLSFLHSQSTPIIFGDLKPSNIMITPENQVKLIDFNLSRYFASFKDPSYKKGTRGYSSPEQFSQGIQDERTDIYSLGAVMHRMITLSNPQDLASAFTFRPVTQLNREASREIEEIISRATANDRSQRYSSAGEVMDDLNSLHAGKTHFYLKRKIDKKKKDRESLQPDFNEEAQSLQAETKPRKSTGSRNQRVLTLIFLLVLVLGAGIGVAWYFGLFPGNDQQGEFKSPFARAQDERIREYRHRGIEHYKRGVATGDSRELAKAASNLTRAVSAHPADTIGQIYLENTRMLLRGRPYIKVAAIASLSGLDFETGTQMIAGINLAQHRHNKSGRGKSILVEIYDDKTTQEEAISIATEIARRDDIMAVIGPIRTPYLQNTAPILNDAGITQISPTGSVSDTEDLGEFIFRTAGDGRNESAGIADFAVRNLGLKRIAVVYDPAQGYSNYQGREFIDTANRISPKSTGEFFISLENPNYSKVVRDIKKYNPDGIYFTGYQLHQVSFFREIDSQGVRSVKMATISIQTPQSIYAGGRTTEGVILYSYFLPELATGAGREFVREFIERYRVNPNFRAAMSYDSMLIISKAVEQGIESSRELSRFIKEQLGHNQKIEGATGNLQFDKFGRRDNIETVILQIRDGEFKKYRAN